MADARGIRAGAAYVELFVTDNKLVRGLKQASARLKAFGTAIGDMGSRMIAATFGYAHYQDDGAGNLELVLGWINEMVDQEACETASSSE